jgi:hypothetical protein
MIGLSSISMHMLASSLFALETVLSLHTHTLPHSHTPTLPHSHTPTLSHFHTLSQSPAAQQQSIQRAVSGAMELVQTLNARVNLAFASSVMELGHSAASSASSMVGAYLSSLVC